MYMENVLPVPINIMVYRTGNVCYFVVISVKVLYCPFKKKQKIQQRRVQQYVFMLTVMYHVVLYTADVHTTNEHHVQCVPQCPDLKGLQTYNHLLIFPQYQSRERAHH